MPASLSSDETNRQRIIIAGAGIGGLSAALTLERAGYAVTVLERANELSEIGAGIQISPNAWRVLEMLGISKRIESLSVRPESIVIHSLRARRNIGRVPLGDAPMKRYGAPYSVIHRGALHAALAAAAAERDAITLMLGVTLSDAQSDDEGITVELQNTGGVSSVRGDALIGADGVWSAVRRRLLRLPPARYSGRTAYRSTVPAVDLPGLNDHTGLWMGSKAHLVHYPIESGRVINVVAIVEEDWREEAWSVPGDRDALLKRFQDWPAQARKMLTIPERWVKWALCDVAPGTIWADGRIALLGDAAHAMLPFMAQGGAMAIEDAHVLARAMSEEADVPTALLAYERARKTRVERVMRMARNNARTYHMDGMTAFARDKVIGFLSGTRMLRRLDWLYGWKPE